ncbi:MAG TPA: rhodanese-like domain-containing protein [Herpetosiphonaceae bacterium]
MAYRGQTTTTTDLTPASVQAQVNAQPPLLVLDVRQPDEYRQGHVAGSILIPLDRLAQRLAELPTDRPIAAICRSGNRSGVAVEVLRRAGFEAYNVTGGMLRWERDGLPVERAP